MNRHAIIALVLVVAAAAAISTLHGTSAAFTAEQTAHLTIGTGSVALTDDGDALAFDAAALAPGDTAKATVTVKAGSLPADVALSRQLLESTAPHGCAIRDALSLRVAEAGRTLTDGPLASAAAELPLGRFAAGETRTYEIALTFAARHGATTADNDNCFQDSVDRERFTWSATEARP